MPTVGTAIIDFGAGNQIATVTVAAASVVATSKIEPYVMADTSPDTNEDSHLIMMSRTVFTCPKSQIVPGVSFDIKGFSDVFLFGKYTINYAGDF